MAELDRIEDGIRGQPPDVRKAVRHEKSKPVVEALEAQFEEQLGRVEIGANSIERRHRVVATVRRNSLLAGSNAGARSWAIFTSLIQTARLNQADPVAWPTDLLERMASGAVKANDLDRLLPWNWKAGHAAKAAAAA